MCTLALVGFERFRKGCVHGPAFEDIRLLYELSKGSPWPLEKRNQIQIFVESVVYK
jgi:hypothetical protein